jgi:phage shock protein A
MRLFRRISDILTANWNDMVDRFEDPEVMLRQAIREMECSLEQVTGSTARAIASENLLVKEQASHQDESRQWRERAEQAVAANDDELARRCLMRKREHETLARALDDHLRTAREANAGLRRQVDAMRAKLAEAKRKLATLTARRRAADARRGLAGLALEGRGELDGFSRFQRLRERLDVAEAEAEAITRLCGEPEEELEAECIGREMDAAVEAELAALKAGRSA